jgi:ferritin-like metal-binding protein YciE
MAKTATEAYSEQAIAKIRSLQRPTPVAGEIQMTQNNLKILYVDELRDLYSSEQQLIKAIPKMAKAANSDELRKGFEEHWEQTKGHATRLEQILRGLGEPVKSNKCKGMAGIVAEGGERMSEGFGGALMDAALISAAQRVEHYEIAAYGAVHAYAVLMGESEAASLLQQTLDEEKKTDQKLTELSQEINSEAFGGGRETDSEETRPRHKTAKAGSAN